MAGHSVFFTGCAGAVPIVPCSCLRRGFGILGCMRGTHMRSSDDGRAPAKCCRRRGAPITPVMVYRLNRDGQVFAAEAPPEGAAPGDHLRHRINWACSIRAGRDHPQRLCRSGALHRMPLCTVSAASQSGAPPGAVLLKLEDLFLQKLKELAGIGRAPDLDSMVKMASQPDAAQRWRRATTVIIDEVRAPDQEPICW